MKTQSNRQFVALLLATAMLGACTHVVVPDPEDPMTKEMGGAAEQSNADRFSNEEIDDAVISANAPEQQAQFNRPRLMPTSAPAPAMSPAPQVAPQPMPNHQAKECTGQEQAPYFNKAGTKTEQIKVRASGYGAPPKAFYSEPQRRLMSMRAAKIDAYRSLAERVKGVQIWGGTTIGDMVVENDRFRVFLDTYLVGAKLIMQTPHEDGSFEATVEMIIGQKMVKELVDNRVMQAPAAEDCAQPATMHTLERERGFAPASHSARVAKSDFYFDRE